MGKVVVHNQPCLECESSDARQVYEDGTSFCFSCRKSFKATGEENFNEIKQKEEHRQYKMNIEEVESFRICGLRDRKIELEVAKFFGVRVAYNTEGEVSTHYYPYNENKAYKVRKLPKNFQWVGSHNDTLFGQDKFQNGGRRLVITEGEIDALTVAQSCKDRYDKIYPVVSVASSTMLNSLLVNRDWIRSFDEVVLWFDQDEPGEHATEVAIKIIGLDKVKIAKSTYKDASDEYMKLGASAVNNVIWDARTYIPSGIVTKEDLWDRLIEFNNKPSIPYPDECLGGVNEKTKGHRTGEISLFISGTGSGKSTMLREDMLHVLETTEDKIGIISLEESPEETARKLAGMVLMKNPAKEEIPLAELKPGFDAVFGEDRVVLLDHQGSMKDESIIDKLEYMALSNCKYLYIDHITILVSEGSDNLQGNEAQDKIMNDLLRLTKRHPVWIGLVSHLRKVQSGSKSFEEGKLPSMDDIKGSGSIKQVSHDIIAFARDMTSEDPIARNIIKMSVLKCRFTGLTGPVRGAYYHYDTGRLIHEREAPESDQFTKIEIPKKKVITIPNKGAK